MRGTASCGGAGYLFLTAIVVGVALLGGLAYGFTRPKARPAATTVDSAHA